MLLHEDSIELQFPIFLLIDPQRTWDVPGSTLANQAVRNMTASAQYNTVTNQTKVWPSDELVWAANRPPTFPTGPPPTAYPAVRQQNGTA